MTILQKHSLLFNIHPGKWALGIEIKMYPATFSYQKPTKVREICVTILCITLSIYLN
jgi:hypothetical protein